MCAVACHPLFIPTTPMSQIDQSQIIIYLIDKSTENQHALVTILQRTVSQNIKGFNAPCHVLSLCYH